MTPTTYPAQREPLETAWELFPDSYTTLDA